MSGDGVARGEPAALELRDLVVPFGSDPGLRPVSLRVAYGERVVLVGASGEGKTSLLRAVAGLAPVTSGRVIIAGADATALRAEHRGAVYLRQMPLLFPHLSVAENVAFPLRVRGVREPEIGERVAEALRAVRLDGYAARAPSRLSGGEAQRVALARATVARPAVLLLDEPLSALDPSLREEVRSSIVRISEEGRAGLVIVTHDLDEAGLLGHRIGVLAGREIAQIDPPAQLFASPASLGVAEFLGIANRIAGSVQGDGTFVATGGALRIRCALAPGPAVAAFRADAVRIRAGGTLTGQVTSHLHRAHGVAVRVEVGDGALEVAVPPHRVPPTGDSVQLEIDPAAVTFFPRP
jgi:putative spermidine/putrescine transport system ATP-binding protein